MLDKMTKVGLTILFVGIITACSVTPFYHGMMMRGQIVSIHEDEVIICIGSADGAEVGMVLNVSEVIYTGSITEGNDNYSLKPVGEVKIKSIINEHFARGLIISGQVQNNNIVELDG